MFNARVIQALQKWKKGIMLIRIKLVSVTNDDILRLKGLVDLSDFWMNICQPTRPFKRFSTSIDA